MSESEAAFSARTKGHPMHTAPRDGTHILAYLYSAPDDSDYRGFGEWREIWWKQYMALGMALPWHAGDPFDSHTGTEAPEHFGEGVPIAWLPLSLVLAAPALLAAIKNSDDAHWTPAMRVAIVKAMGAAS